MSDDMDYRPAPNQIMFPSPANQGDDDILRSIDWNWDDFNENAKKALIEYKIINNQNVDNNISPQFSCVNTDDLVPSNLLSILKQVEAVTNLGRYGESQFPHGASRFLTMEKLESLRCQNKSTQTKLRDSEVQTDPYTPSYTLQPMSAPEILTLATLCYKKGLPAGLAEVELIQRNRLKRGIEEQINLELKKGGNVTRQRKRIEALEYKEWGFRERQIIHLQKCRMAVLKSLLLEREKNTKILSNSRIQRIWKQKEKEMEKKLKKVRFEHIRAMQRLSRGKGLYSKEGKLIKRDIVAEYGDFASAVHAPLTRIGVFPDRGSEMYQVKSQYMNSYEGLTVLENSVPQFVLNPRIKVPSFKKVTYAGFPTRKTRHQNDLNDLYEFIQNSKNQKHVQQYPLRFLAKIYKTTVRPSTPVLQPEIAETQVDKSNATKILQKLIRGRAVQTMMFEGKVKRRELIEEIRSTHALLRAEILLREQERQAMDNLKSTRDQWKKRESIFDEALSHLEGGSLGRILDFLNKELIRLQDERRIHALSMLAERQRRMNEAEESGRRQGEERRRREEDEIFKKVIKVHQETVDTYLEDAILNSMDGTAKELSRKEIEVITTHVNEVAYEMEAHKNQVQSEEISAEMVHQFLIPEVFKQLARERLVANQRKYLLAAHHEILKNSPPILSPEHALDITDSSFTGKVSLYLGEILQGAFRRIKGSILNNGFAFDEAMDKPSIRFNEPIEELESTITLLDSGTSNSQNTRTVQSSPESLEDNYIQEITEEVVAINSPDPNDVTVQKGSSGEYDDRKDKNINFSFAKETKF